MVFSLSCVSRLLCGLTSGYLCMFCSVHILFYSHLRVQTRTGDLRLVEWIWYFVGFSSNVLRKIGVSGVVGCLLLVGHFIELDYLYDPAI